MTAEKILVVRRDNIGDLVCTLPLISALRERYPHAYLAALVNSYNAAVLDNHPAINEVFAYTKLKHRGRVNAFSVYLARVRLLVKLRRKRFDIVFVAGPATKSVMRTVRLIRPARIIRFSGGAPLRHGQTSITAANGVEHEALRTLALLEGAVDAPTPVIYPDMALANALRVTIAAELISARPSIGVHISARKPSQRWPIENFARLIASLNGDGYNVVVLWSPGAQSDARHPGDDEKVELLKAQCVDGHVAFLATPTLPHLIAALSLCEMLICSDGGAMHLAAALGKPIVCLFGDSDSRRWHPFGVPFRLLQHNTRNVEDISVGEVRRAMDELKNARASDLPARPAIALSAMRHSRNSKTSAIRAGDPTETQ